MDNCKMGHFHVQIDESIYFFEDKLEALKFFATNMKSKWLGYHDGNNFIDRKPPVFLTGNYYFLIPTDNYPVIITRTSFDQAQVIFNLYNDISNKCAWIGMWNGFDFVKIDEQLKAVASR